MFQWSKNLGIKQVKMLAEGNADFTRLLGMLVKKDKLGFGSRSWRYSMLVNDEKIVEIFEEPGKADNHPADPFGNSDVDTILNFIKQQ